jgi:predicted dehydrogenase
MDISRRTLLTGAAALAVPTSSFAGVFQDKPTIKVGLIGCGGRGSGAIRDNLAAEEGAVVHAMADLFEDRVKGCLDGLKKDLPKRVDVGERAFFGLDAYEKLLASGVDVVILATPPGFRPGHIRAVIDAGKHLFTEKPVAVDGPGIRDVIESAKLAKEKNLTIVAGTQRRADLAYMECMKRVHDGEIGDILSMNCYWNQGGLWMVPHKDGMTDLEHHVRNWLYYTYLSGDHIVEQHVHNLDVCNWAMRGHPVKAISMGGRQSRVDPAYGHIYDHFATEYEYEGGVKLMSYCRQIDGCAQNVSELIVGSKGRTNANTSIKGEKSWRWEGDRPNPYMLEHRRLYKSIKGSEGYNEGVQVAESTLTAIMGRMSAYSGEEVTWEKALNSQVSLMPANLTMNSSIPVPAVAIPGTTKGVY